MITHCLPAIKKFLPPPKGRSLSSWTMMVRLIASFLEPNRKAGTAQAAGAIRSAPCHRANVARWLEQASLHDGVLLNRSARRLIRAEPRRQRRGCWLLIVDQTACSHQGQQTENTLSRGRRQRRAGYQRGGHAFEVALLISPSGCRIPLCLPYYTPSYAAKHGLVQRTQAELAAALIRLVPLPPHANVLVLGDTAYDAECIYAACRERHYRWICPANPQRVLQEAKPRRKLWKLAAEFAPSSWLRVRFSPCQGPWVHQRRVAACRRGSLAHTTYYAHGEQLQVRHLGKVLVVYSTKQKPSHDQPVQIGKLLLSNDLTLSPAAVVEAYSLRWQIELLFRELKSTLGLGDYRLRAFAKVAGWVVACLLTLHYLEWLRSRQLSKRQLSAKERRWWQGERAHGLCCAVRHQAESRDWLTVGRWCETSRGRARLRRTLQAAFPREYQIPTKTAAR